MSDSYLVIELNQQPVELCKLLKIANLVSGGGEAKVVISEGYVLLNGEVEYQKRKKIYHEDVVEFNGEVVQLIINEDLAETLTEAEPIPEKAQSPAKTKTAEKKAQSKKKPSKATKQDHAVIEQDKSQAKVPRKRKPISF
ncbi:RNA-binding S4 domain-containing protein [Colwellia piezophila]|uniref:RNA-binding S4 domain-containing protein n=1 Tax=Colwellia piezophila TaxID=211668 RepID=UPI00036E725E|nr:RNA-binding S4 domain-containing protein [Colwellia piezophila]